LEYPLKAVTLQCILGERMKKKLGNMILPALLIALCALATTRVAYACVPPNVKILSPENMIYATSSVPLIFTVDKATSWTGYALDEQANVTVSGNATLTALTDGTHYVIVYANDTDGRMGASCKVYFAVDTTPPDIRDVVQSPTGDNVQSDDEVKVNATVTDDVSGVKRATLFYAYANGSGTWIRVVNMTNIEEDIWTATIPKFPYCTNVTYAIAAEDNVGNAASTAEMGYDIQYHVIPESTALAMTLLLLVATSLAAMIYKRKRPL
jgi:hypothetical protein